MKSRLILRLLIIIAVLAPPLAAPRPAQAQAIGHALTEAERALDCRKITGRMTVRILQLRSESLVGSGSPLGNAVQGAARSAASLFWGQSAGAVTARPAQLARDRAQLEAYNGLLAAKGCATFELEAELAKGPDAPTPRPVKPGGKRPAKER